MTPSQLQEKYCTFKDEQLRYLADVFKREAEKNQREFAYINRELKRRNRQEKAND
jgi:hypothetical protein